MYSDDMEQNPSDVCVFCEIAKGTVPASMVCADEHVLAFLMHLVPRVAGDTQQGRIVLDWDNTPHEHKELDRLAADLRLKLQPQGD